VATAVIFYRDEHSSATIVGGDVAGTVNINPNNSLIAFRVDLSDGSSVSLNDMDRTTWATTVLPRWCM
jgi:hypothetical protein